MGKRGELGLLQCGLLCFRKQKLLNLGSPKTRSDQTTPKVGTPKDMKVEERLNGERKVSVGMEGDKRG